MSLASESQDCADSRTLLAMMPAEVNKISSALLVEQDPNRRAGLQRALTQDIAMIQRAQDYVHSHCASQR
jgi:spore coat protein CotF